MPSRNGAAVISAPGRADSQKPARMLARHGYGVLLFDRRGEGESDGDPNIFGWGAERDFNAAVAYLRTRADVDHGRIGGIGLSVGGETLLQAAAQSNGLKAIVSDGAGSRSIKEDIARPGTAKWEEIPTSLVMSVGTALFSNRLPPPEIGSLVGRIAPRPVLFIYGEHDQSNVIDLTPRYYANAGRAQGALESPRRLAHRWHRPPPARVRTACRRILRRGSALRREQIARFAVGTPEIGRSREGLTDIPFQASKDR